MGSILAVDVYYNDDDKTALAAGVIFTSWNDVKPLAEVSTTVSNVLPYEPGSFYKRELPCLIALIKDVKQEIDTIIIDGFVDVDGHAGLGRYLYEALDKKIPIIGVAKTQFKNTECIQLVRKSTSSLTPIYVTSIGIELEVACICIDAMHGDFRIPTLLKRVDHLSRNIS